jgi:hypothetical protein
VRSMVILVLSLVLGVLPLLGIAWIFATGMLTLWPPSATVDGLFMTLILLAVSLCLFLNAFWEARDQGLLKSTQKKKNTAPATAPASVAAKTPAPGAASASHGTPAAKVSS